MRVATIGFGAAGLAGLLAASIGVAPIAPRGGPRVPVLAELFTSEGCSSCPAADALLERLHARQPIDGVELIVLSEHVDYWDRLGWKDPFSSALFTRRQQQYARALGADVYTPQLVLDGHLVAIGSDEPAVRRLARQAAAEPKPGLTLEMTFDKAAEPVVSVAVASGAAPPLDILLAVVEDDVSSQVTRGENARRRLTHVAVVRELGLLEPVDGVAPPRTVPRRLALDPAWRRERLRLVAFAAHRPTGRIVGVASRPLDDASW
jgi:hypothetical protein